jgi:amino acid adenylation domain-containing protein
MERKTVEGYRLSPQQKQLWSLQQTSTAFRAQCILSLTGDLNLEAFKQALQIVINRHEILRTTFQRLPGVSLPFQVVGESCTPTWRTFDLGDLEPQAQKVRLEALFREEGDQPFDFEHGPLLRLSLLMLSASERVLLMNLPALCSDARTLKNLLQEISRCYAAALHGEELSDDAFQYADYSEWQYELIEAEDENAETGRAYWHKQLLAAPPPPSLPFEARTNSNTPFAPEAVTLQFDSHLSDGIRRVASRHEATVSDLLLSCWQTLLWRLSEQAEISVSTLFNGRKYEELHEGLGLFAKHLPVLAHLEAEMPFREVVRQVREAAREAEEWQEYFSGEESGVTVVDAPDGSVGFSFAEEAGQESAAGVCFSIRKQYACTESCKLKLKCEVAKDGVSAEIEYDPRVYKRDAIERLGEQFEMLLGSAVKDAAAAISELEIFSASERQRLVEGFNETAAEYPREKCIQELFEEQVERTPEALAVVFEREQLSYAELNGRANQLAQYLKKCGVGPDVCVGLCVERSVEMVVGLLGILKAGGAYVPLNPEHPKARLSQQLADIQSPILITQEKLLRQLPDFKSQVICLDRDRALFEADQKENPGCITAPHDLVYVIYTSGSTGTPKGVAVTHQNLVNYTHFISQKLRLQEPANVGLHFATVSTLGADLGNTCIFPSLVSGGCLHILGYELATDGGMFAEYVSEHPIDVLKIVPSHLSALLASRTDVNILPRKYLILGGETFSWDLFRRIAELAGDCEVINHYGPTETTVGSLTYSLSEKDAHARSSATVPIGRPLANTRIYILDRDLKPVPVGLPGQLHIGGAGLARGYLNQPEQTAARFIPSPFSADEDVRLYQTGDLARYLPDGNVEFLGRLDDQVKIRGFRIELGEVETVLGRHTGVREAAVLARGDEASEKRLVAYVVPARETTLTKDDLRSFLLEVLPDYMVPSSFVMLQALPLTRNGKVDRQALPAPEQELPDLQRAFMAPRNQTEEALAGIWAEVLRLERIGVQDNFFELGGHSLLVTQVVARLRNYFQISLPLHSLFESPTIEGLAVTIARCRVEQQEMARLVAELEDLSEEEAQRLLTTEMQQSGESEDSPPAIGMPLKKS